MNTRPIRSVRPLLLTLVAAAPLAALAISPGAGCASKPATGTEETEVIRTKDGVAVIESYQINATVTAVDAANRKLTIKTADGGSSTVKAGKYVNVGAFKPGDKVSATVCDEMALYLRRDGAPPSTGEADAVAVAAGNTERDVFMADTVQVTARVTAINPATRAVTLQFANGTTRTIKVGSKVDLGNIAVGNDVVARVTEAMMVAAQRPQ